MSRSHRLIELMMTINTKRKFTVGELAREFNVSKRTILRDLHSLTEAGLPLYSEVGASGGYQILKERTLPPISFSENEAIAIFFAVQSLDYYKSLPFKSESISALTKFYNYLPIDVKEQINELKDRITFWIPSRELPAPHLRDLLMHVIKRHVVSIVYDSDQQHTLRDIQPIGTYSMNGLWYCPAYCFKSEQIRLFRIDRIREMVLSNNQQPKKGIKKITIHQYLQSFDEDQAALPLVVKLTKLGVRRCESDFWLAKHLSISPDGTGQIEAKIGPSFIEWAADFFIGCGSEAMVEQPEDLITRIQEKIEDIQNHYCK
jgi:predicted DNA-binding transcriptional regulator YafY